MKAKRELYNKYRKEIKKKCIAENRSGVTNREHLSHIFPWNLPHLFGFLAKQEKSTVISQTKAKKKEEQAVATGVWFLFLKKIMNNSVLCIIELSELPFTFNEVTLH